MQGDGTVRAGVNSRRPRESHIRYIARKTAELALIERLLVTPPPAPPGDDLAALLKRKFQSAALCRAQTAAALWSQTETKWQAGPCDAGAFRFDYAYQRADLSVEGPKIYGLKGVNVFAAHYTASGMAALSAVLLAFRRLWPRCRFDVRPDGYPEIGEIAAFLDADKTTGGERVVVVDATVDTRRSCLGRIAGADAVIFDTSCFASSSGRIQAVASIVGESGMPFVLVRSHTKLDCFGLDYGRLGSVVVAGAFERNRDLNDRIADAIRLTGLAALPLHFPPFADGEAYRTLTRARAAWTIRATRSIAARLKHISGLTMRTFAHGLYLVLFPVAYADKDDASAAAEDLMRRFVEAKLPARHAGSFGFDFFASDWFEDGCSGDIGIRLAVGDLPEEAVERAIDIIVAWLENCAAVPAPQSHPGPSIGCNR